MKTNWRHQLDAHTTDLSSPTDDQRVNEDEKQHLKESKRQAEDMNPGKRSRVPAPKAVRDGKRGKKR
jgi:hypothetical protein